MLVQYDIIWTIGVIWICVGTETHTHICVCVFFFFHPDLNGAFLHPAKDAVLQHFHHKLWVWAGTTVLANVNAIATWLNTFDYTNIHTYILLPFVRGNICIYYTIQKQRVFLMHFMLHKGIYRPGQARWRFELSWFGLFYTVGLNGHIWGMWGAGVEQVLSWERSGSKVTRQCQVCHN